jgi:hypothetical protein
MKTTEFRPTKDRTFVQATYGLHHIGNQAPYFSITLNEYKMPRVNERQWLSGGCQHDLVREVFPELAPLIRWHLCSENGPMHYIANGLHWHDCFHGVQKYKRPEDRALAPSALASTVVLGALPDDVSIDALLAMSRADVEAYLQARLPRLLAAFQADMQGMETTND